MKKKSINISINDKDETKSQVVYNNVLNSMEKSSMTSEDQLNYLKKRISYLEDSTKERQHYVLCGFIFLVVLALGIFLTIIKYATFGVVLILISFFGNMFFTYKIAKKYNVDYDNTYEEIDAIRELINSKLK